MRKAITLSKRDTMSYAEHVAKNKKQVKQGTYPPNSKKKVGKINGSRITTINKF